MSKSQITTHVLDTANGRPAAGVPVVLDFRPTVDDSFARLGAGITDDDGRVADLLPADHQLQPGVYRLEFDLAAAFASGSFWALVPIVFTVEDASQHYHVPLLVSPYGYSTYRGS